MKMRFRHFLGLVGLLLLCSCSKSPESTTTTPAPSTTPTVVETTPVPAAVLPATTVLSPKTPVLTKVSGDNQSAQNSIFVSNPLVVAVSISGSAVVNAPVAFHVGSGSGFLAATPGGAVASTLYALTGTDGTASASYACPVSGTGPFTVTGTTGVSPRIASVQFTAAATIPDDSVPAPSGVISRYYGSGSVFISWTNNDNGTASAYDIERSTDNQTWMIIGTVQKAAVFIDSSAPTGGQLYYRVNSR